jgi:hypothetical protein
MHASLFIQQSPPTTTTTTTTTTKPNQSSQDGAPNQTKLIQIYKYT